MPQQINLTTIPFNKFVDVQSGWSFSPEEACNMVLSIQDTKNFINKPSPYSISELSRTIFNEYEPEIQGETINDFNRNIPCNTTNLLNEPCWGGNQHQPNATNSYNTDAGCDRTSTSWYSPIYSEEANQFKPIGTSDTNIGKWESIQSWGPNGQGTINLPGVNCPSGCKKLSYTTHLLVTKSSVDKITSGTPLLAKIIINLKQVRLTSAFNDSQSKMNVNNLLQYAFQYKPQVNIASIRNTIKSLKPEFASNLKNLRSRLPIILGNEGIVDAETKSLLETTKQHLMNIITQYSKISPILNFIFDQKMKTSNLEAPIQSSDDFQNLINNLTNVYKFITNVGDTVVNHQNVNVENILNILDNDQGNFSNFKQNFINSLNNTHSTNYAYMVVSAALVATPDCSIANISSDGQNTSYTYCNSSAGSCPELTGYICPFSNNRANQEWCQSISNYQEIRQKVYKWLNTYVSSNGCIQRTLSQKYGKCVQLNWPSEDKPWIQYLDEGRTGGSWDPQSNKINFLVDSNMDKDLFKTTQK